MGLFGMDLPSVSDIGIGNIGSSIGDLGLNDLGSSIAAGGRDLQSSFSEQLQDTKTSWGDAKTIGVGLGVQGPVAILGGLEKYLAQNPSKVLSGAGALMGGGGIESMAGGLAGGVTSGDAGGFDLSSLGGLFGGGAGAGTTVSPPGSSSGGYGSGVSSPSPVSSALPVWAIPAMIGAGVLVLVLVLRK